MSVVVIATIVPLPQYRDDVLAAFRAAVPQVHAEDGCELYALHEAEDRLVMIERWTSAEALAAHGKGAALAVLRPAVEGKLAVANDVVRMQAVPAGDPAKGRL
jgi:quinol monooxygenase YgiN